MFKIFRKELDWGGTRLVLETGKVARQADGAVMVSLGETSVLCTAVAAQTAKPGQDFFPLTVNYQEKAFAAGKIPGGFFKREGRPSENETLVSRLIDRPIRPLFPKSFKCETQVICTVLAHDMENNPDIAAMIGASAALTLSGVPFFVDVDFSCDTSLPLPAEYVMQQVTGERDACDALRSYPMIASLIVPLRSPLRPPSH